MAIDLGLPDAKALAERGVPVEIMDPADMDKQLNNAVGEPLVIRVIGADASKIRSKANAQLDKHYERQRKGKGGVTSEQSEQEIIDICAAATVSWNLKTPDGSPIDCNEHNARLVYGDPRYPYLQEQVFKVIGDRSRFFGTSSPASSNTSAGTPS